MSDRQIWQHLEEDKAKREKIAQSPCCICGKTIGPNWTGSNGRYAHPECGRPREAYEARPCTACGYVRRVKVTRHPIAKTESFKQICTACELEASARRHTKWARQLSAKAQKIRARQKNR